MKKQPEITAQTKQSLIDAFWWFYCLKRIEKITIKEITQKAGYHRGTFYEYFSDVYDLLEQIENSLLPEVDELPSLLQKPDESTFSMSSIIGMYTKHSNYYTILLGDNGDPAFSGKLKNSIKNKLMKNLSHHGEKDNFTLDYALEFVLSAMISVLTYWYRNGQNAPQEEIIKLIYELMMNGSVKIFA